MSAGLPYAVQSPIYSEITQLRRAYSSQAWVPFIDAKIGGGERWSGFVVGVRNQRRLGCADFHVEELEYRAEEGDSSQAWVPLRLIRPKHAKGPLPTVIYLHATGAPTPLRPQAACTGNHLRRCKALRPFLSAHSLGHEEPMLKAHWMPMPSCVSFAGLVDASESMLQEGAWKCVASRILMRSTAEAGDKKELWHLAQILQIPPRRVFRTLQACCRRQHGSDAGQSRGGRKAGLPDGQHRLSATTAGAARRAKTSATATSMPLCGPALPRRCQPRNHQIKGALSASSRAVTAHQSSCIYRALLLA